MMLGPNVLDVIESLDFRSFSDFEVSGKSIFEYKILSPDNKFSSLKTRTANCGCSRL